MSDMGDRSPELWFGDCSGRRPLTVAFFYRLQGGIVRASKVGAGIAIMGLAGVFGVAGAAPASAVSSGCSILDGRTFVGTGDVTGLGFLFEAGEVLTATWTNLSVPGTTVSLQVPIGIGDEVDSRTGAGSVSYTFPANTTTTFLTVLTSGTGDVAFTCGVPAPSPVVEDQAPAPIPSWVQAYGRDKEATCLDGWDASWQSWAEPVTGGWVCTRSIPSLG